VWTNHSIKAQTGRLDSERQAFLISLPGFALIQKKQVHFQNNEMANNQKGKM
jgi:hypothetical protein